MSVPIDEKLEEIAAACQRYGIERLFVFGSALRDDFKPGAILPDSLPHSSPQDEAVLELACALIGGLV